MTEQSKEEFFVSTNLAIEASRCILAPPKPDWEKYQKPVGVRRGMLPAESAARFEADSQIAELDRRHRDEHKRKRLGLSVLSPRDLRLEKGKASAFCRVCRRGGWRMDPFERPEQEDAAEMRGQLALPLAA